MEIDNLFYISSYKMVLIVTTLDKYKLPIKKTKQVEKPVASVDGRGIGELITKLKSVKIKNDDLRDIRITL